MAVGTLPQNLEPAPPLPQLPGSLEEATRIGIERNPAIVAAQFAERAAVYDFDRARAAKGPTVSVSGSAGVERATSRRTAARPPTRVRAWDGDDLRPGRHRGRRCRSTPAGSTTASCGRRRRCSTSAATSCRTQARTVTEAVANAWTQLDVARASIVARREQVEAARIAAEGVAEEARLGARSTLDVLDADQERLQAEAEVVRAMRDEYVAAYGLLQAMGLLTVEHLRLGVDALRARRQLPPGAERPAGRLRHLRGRPHPRALGAQLMADAPGRPGEPESIAEVLASIRALVSAETEARLTGKGGGETVLMLTGDMRVPGGLAEGLGRPAAASDAPILDEASLRGVINTIVREELEGELGDRINRNLRKLIRREIVQVLEEQRKA